jgi:hypothetical protein
MDGELLVGIVFPESLTSTFVQVGVGADLVSALGLEPNNFHLGAFPKSLAGMSPPFQGKINLPFLSHPKIYNHILNTVKDSCCRFVLM